MVYNGILMETIGIYVMVSIGSAPGDDVCGPDHQR